MIPQPWDDQTLPSGVLQRAICGTSVAETSSRRFSGGQDVERIYYGVCSKQDSYQDFVRWEGETGEKNEENGELAFTTVLHRAATPTWLRGALPATRRRSRLYVCCGPFAGESVRRHRGQGPRKHHMMGELCLRLKRQLAPSRMVLCSFVRTSTLSPRMATTRGIPAV
jgi:hypothetical protein